MLMGPGSANKQLQDCPPVEHWELTEDELMEAFKDPGGVAKRLGLKTPKTILVHVAEPSIE